jgi:hypothetical protein
MAKFLDHEFGGIGVQRLSDGRHHAHLHQRLDDFRRSCGHTIGEFLDGNLLRQDNVAHHLDLVGAKAIEFSLTTLALTLPANRGQRTNFFVLALDRGLHIDATCAAAIVGSPFRRNDRGFASGQPSGAGSASRTSFVLVFRPSSTQAQRLSHGRGCGRDLSPTGGFGDWLRRLRWSRLRSGRWSGRSFLSFFAWFGRGPRLRGGGFRFGGSPGLCLLSGQFLGTPGIFFGGFSRLGFATARFLGRGEDRDLLLLAAFRFAFGGVALLLDKGTLTGGLFGGSQCTPSTRGRTARCRSSTRSGSPAGRRGRRGSGGGRGVRRRSALFPHFNLHDF